MKQKGVNTFKVPGSMTYVRTTSLSESAKRSRVANSLVQLQNGASSGSALKYNGFFIKLHCAIITIVWLPCYGCDVMAMVNYCVATCYPTLDISFGATVSAVPESSTDALLCISMGIVGFARKRMILKNC